MIYLPLIAMFLLIIPLGILLFNILTGPYLKRMSHSLTEKPLVSVLVPARNEENVIEKCLTSLLNQRYDAMEIIVLDDQSTDGTKEIIENIAKNNTKITIINGKPLPKGWTGKNFACHQLAGAASGEILLFTDADTWHHPDAVLNTVSAMKHHHLDLLSAFSQQIMKTLPEKLLIPSVDILVYSMLPLWGTLVLPFSSVSAANGQWIAFTRSGYDKIGGHEKVKSEIVEDVYLARLAKKQGLRTLTVAGTGRVFCRMYRTFPEMWEGVKKSIMGIMNYSYLMMTGAVLFLTVTMILPFVFIFFSSFMKIAMILIMLNLLYRVLLSLTYKHPLMISMLLHPVSVILFIAAMVASALQYKKGYFTWKARKIMMKETNDE